ncbi:MAG: hypothetical protein HY898_16930 [Deltaproteobacteria bacterium]|nr:hypothetical protein [Deltaproteobacteria bacterium]
MQEDDDEAAINDWELPDRQERERLLLAVRRIATQTSWEPWVRAPVLDASGTWFPDAWSPDRRGVKTLLRRILTYVGLGEAAVHVQIGRGLRAAQFDHQGVGTGGKGAAAWFWGWEGNVCRFGVDKDQLGDLEALVGTLCHEVCHAWRAHHGVVAKDPRVEEQLTDVTAVVLGFGVLVLNSAYRFRTNVVSPGGAALGWDVSLRGYLSPGQLAWLLAAQLDARNADGAERRRVAGALASNQRKLLEDAWEVIQRDSLPVRATLGTPEPAQWPPERDRVVAAFPDDDDVESGEEEAAVDPGGREPAHTATLQVQSRAFLGLVVAAVIAGCACYVVELDGRLVAVALVVLCLAGAGIGHGLPRRTCSACGTLLGRKADSCRGCGARIVVGGQTSPQQQEGYEEESLAYFDDMPVEEESTIALANAALVQWAIRRGFASDAFRASAEALVDKAMQGNASADSLAQVLASAPDFAWMTDRGAAFGRYYCGTKVPCLLDDWHAAAAYAAETGTPAHRERFELWLDRRWWEWSRESGEKLPHEVEDRW